MGTSDVTDVSSTPDEAKRRIGDGKIRVLMIGPDRSVHGGISAVVNGYYEAGLDEAVDLRYIGTMKEGSKIYKLLVAGVAYLRFCSQLKWADVVHVNVASDNSFWRKSFFIKKAHEAGKKIVLHQHGGEWEEYYSSLDARTRNKIGEVLRMADVFLVLSPAYKEFFEDKFGIEGIKVFPNAIKVPEIETEATSSLTEKAAGVVEIVPCNGPDLTNDAQNGAIKLLFLGRICEAKGIRELVEAVRIINTEILRIVGEGERLELSTAGIFEDASLEALIAKYPEFIRYAGWVTGEAKEKLLKENDIFILPSYFEGMPVSVLEAMAYGKPVIATNVGGIPMMIENGVSGLLIEPKSTQAIVDAIKYMLDNPDAMKQMGRNAYRTVKEHINIERTIKELCEIYSDRIKNCPQN